MLITAAVHPGLLTGSPTHVHTHTRMLNGTFGRFAGALAHTLELDDLHRASVTHPGCIVVPAVMGALGRSPEAVSGHRVLRSVLVGYEVMCRVGMALGQAHYRVWHSTATAGPLGAAAAVGTLRGLSHGQLVDALGNSGHPLPSLHPSCMFSRRFRTLTNGILWVSRGGR